MVSQPTTYNSAGYNPTSDYSTNSLLTNGMERSGIFAPALAFVIGALAGIFGYWLAQEWFGSGIKSSKYSGESSLENGDMPDGETDADISRLETLTKNPTRDYFGSDIAEEVVDVRVGKTSIKSSSRGQGNYGPQNDEAYDTEKITYGSDDKVSVSKESRSLYAAKAEASEEKKAEAESADAETSEADSNGGESSESSN